MANQDYYRFVSELNANGAGDAHGGEEDDAKQGACNDKSTIRPPLWSYATITAR